MDKKIAEFIGVMLGDGSIGIYDCKAGDKIKKHYVIKVTLDSRNKQYLYYVFNLMKDVLDIEPKIHFKKNENAVDIRVFKRDKIAFVLNEIGLKISPKWNNMEIPEKYSRGEISLFVLKGLFDTDGCLSIFNNNGLDYPRIEIKICPSPVQNQVISILNEFNFKFTIQNLDKGKIRIRISGKNELKKWFELIGSANSIHLEKASRFLKKKVL